MQTTNNIVVKLSHMSCLEYQLINIEYVCQFVCLIRIKVMLLLQYSERVATEFSLGI